MDDNHTPENDTNGGVCGVEGGPPDVMGSKRQRRPSVRLGDIVSGETHVRRTVKSSKNDSKASKNRPLTNLSEFTGNPDGKDANLDRVIGTWKVKDSKKRVFKRVRSNWASRIDAGGGDSGGVAGCGGGGGSGGGEDVDNGCQDFDRENLESPGRDLSLGRDNLGGGDEREMGYRRRSRVCYNGDEVEFSGPSDTEGREWRSGSGDDGVRIWLNGLGLGRYAPVFEIHEVDNEVLPLLTLEDLKDMGINAVGSRRKMFCAIQKLGKGFS